MSKASCKGKRQYAPKAKTGCGTCKKRHLKCGEERPECANCLSSSIVCEGYGIWGGGTKATTSTGKSEKAIRRAERSAQGNLPFTTRCLSRHHTPIPFQNISHAEQSCFDYFANKTVLKIPGVFFSPFWADLALRACATEPPIVHAAVAVGSAHRSADLNLYGSSVPTSFLCCTETRQLDAHETFALQQYNKSIAQLRRCRFEEENVAEVRTALVACVLYVSLELLRGNYSTAVIHTRHGLNLLSRLGRDFDVQAQHPERAPESVEDYLFEAFTRLTLQSAHVGVIDAYFDVDQGQSLLANWKLPHAFADMFEARRTFDSLMHLTLTLPSRSAASNFADFDPQEISSEFIAFPGCNVCMATDVYRQPGKLAANNSAPALIRNCAASDFPHDGVHPGCNNALQL
ncbi:hypothetical protein H2200_010340 [Cladophialophora chaetospira]|uniref:Zn(2)-C6 fungal-type domain-containing protein n=1 Tax=Cladophialophora chaetospira TaxID=386627 RepID=A0AA38X196_9EURO|nr:hypothetical protein H2200_010340 [Cladophialophora chaetospira]